MLHLPAAENALTPWLTTGVGALVGAILGILLLALYTRAQERRHFQTLLAELNLELVEVRDRARGRIAETDSMAGALEPPLPTEAWRLLQATGDLSPLPAAVLGRLRVLYSQVADANYVASHWCCFMQISRLSRSPEVFDAFDHEAARALSERCRPIADGIGLVIQDIAESSGRPPRPKLRLPGRR